MKFPQLLSLDDLEFLQVAEALKSPLDKVAQAKRLLAEAREELAAELGGKKLRKPRKPAKNGRKTKGKKKKKKGGIEVSYKAPIVEIGGEDDVAAVRRVLKGAMKFDAVQKAAGLSSGRTRTALWALRDEGKATLEGKGSKSVWVRQ